MKFCVPVTFVQAMDLRREGGTRERKEHPSQAAHTLAASAATHTHLTYRLCATQGMPSPLMSDSGGQENFD